MIGAHMMYITWGTKIHWPRPQKNGQDLELCMDTHEVPFYCLQNNPAGNSIIPGLLLEVKFVVFSIKSALIIILVSNFFIMFWASVAVQSLPVHQLAVFVVCYNPLEY